MKNKNVVDISSRIFISREQKVMLDRDLAELYDVEVKVLNQAVKRNIKRFPSDLMFQLDSGELDDLRSQTVTANLINTRNHMRRTLPYVFTESGAFALSFILKSDRAIEMGLFIIRAFTHLRRFVLKNENLMMELQKNDHLSKTFSNFEKRIEQNLIVLYKNNKLKDKRIERVEKKLKQIEEKIGCQDTFGT
jgi:hypothetical protein